MGIEIKLRTLEWASKYSFQKIFAAAVAFIINLCYPFKTQLYLHNLYINSMLKYMNTLAKSGHRKILAWCRVGREKFLPHDEWAAKKILVKSHWNPVPPQVINNDRSLNLFHLTGYKIKDDRKFLGTFIMSFYALVTHLFRYYYMYYFVRWTENTINSSFIIYFTSRNGDSFNNLHYTLHLSWKNHYIIYSILYRSIL